MAPPRNRGRPSASATTRASPSASSAPRALPPYQPPSQPLSASGQRSLSALTSVSSSTTTAKTLKAHLKSANEILSDVTDNINEMASLHAQVAEKKRKKRAAAGSQGNEEEEESEEERAREMERTVEGLTTEIEGKVRGLIDARARVDAREKALKEVASGIGDGLGGGGRGTQSTLGASQFRRGRAEDEDEDDDEDEEEERGTGARPGSGPGVPALFKDKLEQWEEQYKAMGMKEKYASHNDYIAFKKSLHSGLHANTENPPPVPHSNSWFRAGSDGVEAPHALLSRNATSSQAGDEDVEGSDVEAVAVSINIKCPITLLPMKDPVTSKKCPHSFEKSAIEDMMSLSSTQMGGSGTRALRCPVCSVLLTTADLEPDPVLRRNIQRIVAAEQARNNRDEDEDYARHNSRSPKNRAQSIDSDYEGRQSLAPRVKAERVRSSMMRNSVVPNTQLG